MQSKMQDEAHLNGLLKLASEAETQHGNIKPEGFASDIFHTLQGLKRKEFEAFAEKLQESPAGALALLAIATEKMNSVYRMLPQVSYFRPAARLTAEKKVKGEMIEVLNEITERGSKLAAVTEKKDTPFKELLHDSTLGILWANYNNLHEIGAMDLEMFKRANVIREAVECAGPIAPKDTPEMRRASNWLTRFGGAMQDEYQRHEQIRQNASEDGEGEEDVVPEGIAFVLAPQTRGPEESEN